MIKYLIKGLRRFSWGVDETGNPLSMQRRLWTRRMRRSGEVEWVGRGSAPKSSLDEGFSLMLGSWLESDRKSPRILSLSSRGTGLGTLCLQLAFGWHPTCRCTQDSVRLHSMTILSGQMVPGRAPVGIESCPSRKNTSSPFLSSPNKFWREPKSPQEVLLLLPPLSLSPLLLQVPVLLSLPGWTRCRWRPRVCTAAAAAAATGGRLLPLHRGESWGGLLMLLPLWAPHQQRTLTQHRSHINRFWQQQLWTTAN